MSLGRSSVSGIGTEGEGWPAPLGAGGRPSSALAANPPAERRASAMRDPRATAHRSTPGSQQTIGLGPHRTSRRYSSTASTSSFEPPHWPELALLSRRHRRADRAWHPCAAEREPTRGGDPRAKGSLADPSHANSSRSPFP